MLAACALAVASPIYAASTPPIVRVYVAGSPEAVSGSRDAIQDLCSRSNVAVVVRDAAGADEALLSTSHAPGLAEAYVDLRPGTAPRVVVVDGETRQDLERRTLPEGESLEISIETVAHVVCTAVQSTLAARAAPPAAPPVRAEQRAESTEPRPFELEPGWASQVSVFASAANFGAGFRGGLGAALGVSHGTGSLRFALLFGVTGYPASDVESAGGVASFGLLGARLLPALEWHTTPAVTAFVGVGGGADWLHLSAQTPPPGAVGQSASGTVDPAVSGLLGVRLHIANGVSALIGLDADVDLSRHRYVTRTDQGSQVFFEPSRVRPVALAGLSVSLGGASEPPLREARR